MKAGISDTGEQDSAASNGLNGLDDKPLLGALDVGLEFAENLADVSLGADPRENFELQDLDVEGIRGKDVKLLQKGLKSVLSRGRKGMNC